MSRYYNTDIEMYKMQKENISCRAPFDPSGSSYKGTRQGWSVVWRQMAMVAGGLSTIYCNLIVSQITSSATGPKGQREQ